VNPVLKEHEIRPASLFEMYLDLAAEDLDKFFADVPREPMACPACDSEGELAFEKLGFSYRECQRCWSPWVSPRPTFESFVSFYSNSASSRYWAEVFYPAVESVRREKLWRPKARQVADIAEGSSVAFNNLVDIGGGSGTFAEEFIAVCGLSVVVIEPSPESAAACRERGIAVIESFLEDVQPSELPQGHSIFTSFELFEHVHDPRHWLGSIADLMQSEDVLVVTTLSGLGLDIRTLWDQSDSVSPPHHINFLNPASMSQLAMNAGLETLRVFTPGVLDLDIMKNNRAKVTDRFWTSVLDASDEVELSRWQQFISDSGRSSHMWAVLQKP
jgi:2-polyprenyl-3-methyl-5-hydroxy-6-metoxy-1,4-benzoquinol methylase